MAIDDGVARASLDGRLDGTYGGPQVSEPTVVHQVQRQSDGNDHIGPGLVRLVYLHRVASRATRPWAASCVVAGDVVDALRTAGRR